MLGWRTTRTCTCIPHVPLRHRRARFSPTPLTRPLCLPPSSPSPCPLPQELINSRAAMLGFVAAIVSELLTQRSIFVQLAGTYDGLGRVVDHPIGAAPMAFFFIVIAVTFGTFAPSVYGDKATDRSFGPFKPAAEILNGRAAMLGFAALLVVEAVRGGAALF